MKSMESGKELINIWDDLKIEFNKRKNVAIFGAGVVGKMCLDTLRPYNLVKFFIDNSTEKQGTLMNDIPIVSLNDYLQKSKGWIIIACASPINQDIRKQLIKKNMKEKKDFWLMEDFYREVMPILSYYNYNKVFVNVCQICLTERCTLKCKYCAHGCNKVAMNSEDMSLEKIKKSADSFFNVVDWVNEFVLIGGEPFLSQSLLDSIDYIGRNYRDKINIFSITTNGTILPLDTIVEKCKTYNVTIRVSDYSRSIPRLKEKYEDFYKKLSELNVLVWKTQDNSWVDYGFGKVDNGDDEEKLTQIFDSCLTDCREINGNKYYFCVMARSINDNYKINVGNMDYFSMENIKDKTLFVEYNYGFSEKGYLEMCRYCRGIDAKNYPIPAAEQDANAIL